MAEDAPRFRIIAWRQGNADSTKVKLATPIDVAHLPDDAEMRRLVGAELPPGRVYPVYQLLKGGDEHRSCPICYPQGVRLP